MSNVLRPPSLGPIVGHTTPNSARLWIRGADVEGARTVGVAALFEKGAMVSGSARYFRLHREYDRTGVVDLEGLKPGTAYRVRLGSLAIDSVDDSALIDDDHVFDRLPDPQVWGPDLAQLPERECEASFSTFPDGAAQEEFTFLMGSCRYPGLWNPKRSDEIFLTMKDHLARSPGVRFLLMVGDQIYADKLNRNVPIGRAETQAEFRERYLTAFGSPHLRSVMRTLPTYMILDDHEIEDNWVQGRIARSDKRALFMEAIQAYLSYQWVHGPRSFGSKRLFYEFDCAGFPFFVLDERTQRIRDDDDDDLSDNHLLGYPSKPGSEQRSQLDELCDWLTRLQKDPKTAPGPKFVVSPSVFVPNFVDERGEAGAKKSDSWPAFPNTRRTLLQAILANQVQNVIFLSGDVHCSNVAEIRFEGPKGKGLKAFSITSSAFYWPFPFADGDPNGFVHDSEKEKDGFDIDGAHRMHYRAWAFEQEDNFTRISVGQNDSKQPCLRVQNFDRKGKPLGKEQVLVLG